MIFFLFFFTYTVTGLSLSSTSSQQWTKITNCLTASSSTCSTRSTGRWRPSTRRPSWTSASGCKACATMVGRDGGRDGARALTLKVWSVVVRCLGALVRDLAPVSELYDLMTNKQQLLPLPDPRYNIIQQLAGTKIDTQILNPLCPVMVVWEDTEKWPSLLTEQNAKGQLN